VLDHFFNLTKISNFVGTVKYDFTQFVDNLAVDYFSGPPRRRKAAVVTRKVAESVRFDCGQYYCCFAVFAVYLRFFAVVKPQRTAD